MEPQTWIKWSEVSKSTKLTEGQLNVPRVCKRFGMDPDTLEIAGREVEWSRNTGYSSNFPDLCQHQLGDGTEDNPIQVDGKPLQGAGTTADMSAEVFQDALRSANPSPDLTSSQNYIAAMTDPGLRLPVPEHLYQKWQASGMDQQSASRLLPVPGSIISDLANLCGHLIDFTPLEAHAELTTTFAMFSRVETVLRAFLQFGGLQFEFSVFLNSTERETSSRALVSGTRPDFAASAKSCTLVIGEDQVGGELIEAVADLRRKCPGFSALHYGDVQYIFTYAAAGYDVQWHLIGREGELINVGSIMSLKLLAGRISVLHMMLNVFRLVSIITSSDMLPPVSQRLQLFVMHNHGASQIYFNNKAAIKMVPCYGDFASRNYTSLEVLQRAYSAAAVAANEQSSNRKQPFMVWASEGPKMITGRRDTLRVVIQPLGGPVSPPSEEKVLGQMVYAWCRALAVLHKAGIVLRDIRDPNMAKLDDCHYLVLDYEHCGWEGELLPPTFTLKNWDANTMVDPPAPDAEKQGWRVYDQYSDLYQLGVAIEPHIRATYSDRAKQLLTSLKARELTATEVLEGWQPWFTQCGVSY